MPGFDGYTQSVVLNLVNGKQLSGNQNGASIAKSAYTGALRLTININKLDPTSGQSNTVFSINCIRVEE